MCPYCHLTLRQVTQPVLRERREAELVSGVVVGPYGVMT